jgi:hypothetical protein
MPRTGTSRSSSRPEDGNVERYIESLVDLLWFTHGSAVRQSTGAPTRKYQRHARERDVARVTIGYREGRQYPIIWAEFANSGNPSIWLSAPGTSPMQGFRRVRDFCAES